MPARKAMDDPVVLAESVHILSRRPAVATAEDGGAGGGAAAHGPVVILSADPLIYTIDDFFTAGECEYLISLAEPSMRRAVVTGARGPKTTGDRTSGNSISDAIFRNGHCSRCSLHIDVLRSRGGLVAGPDRRTEAYA